MVYDTVCFQSSSFLWLAPTCIRGFCPHSSTVLSVGWWAGGGQSAADCAWWQAAAASCSGRRLRGGWRRPVASGRWPAGSLARDCAGRGLECALYISRGGGPFPSLTGWRFGLAGGIQVQEAAGANPTTIDMIKIITGNIDILMRCPHIYGDYILCVRSEIHVLFKRYTAFKKFAAVIPLSLVSEGLCAACGYVSLLCNSSSQA